MSRRTRSLGIPTRHQVAQPWQPRNLIAIAAASLPVPASVSSSLSSTRDTLVSRMPLLVIRFHIYKKKIIISKTYFATWWRTLLDDETFQPITLRPWKGSFDRDISIYRSSDSTPEFMTTWDFISFTDSIHHNSHIKNNYFLKPITLHLSTSVHRSRLHYLQHLTRVPLSQWVRMTRPDSPSTSGVKQVRQPHQQDSSGVDLKFIPASSPESENIPD